MSQLQKKKSQFPLLPASRSAGRQRSAAQVRIVGVVAELTSIGRKVMTEAEGVIDGAESVELADHFGGGVAGNEYRSTELAGGRGGWMLRLNVVQRMRDGLVG